MFGDPQTSGRGVEFQVNDNGYEFISLLNGSNNTFRLVSNSSKHYISHSLGSATQYELTIPLKTGTLATLDDITTPQNMVTTNTDQTLSGVKTWTNEDSSYSWELITSYDGINSTRTDKGTNTTSSATYNSEGFDLYVGRDDDSTYSVGIASDGTIYVYEEDGQGNTTSSDIEIRNTGNNEQLAYLSDLDDYQEVITKTTVTSGSIDEVIGFNSNGELVRSQGSGNVDVLTVYEVEDIVNQQLYTCNSITVSVTNGTYTGNTVIPQENGTATVEIIPIAGYGPDSTTLTVSGASYTYDSQTKTISLSAPTGNVTISVTCSPNILLTSNNEVLNTSGGDRILFN